MFFFHGFYNHFLEFRRISFVWYSFWHSKTPHLLDSISYCLTCGVLFNSGSSSYSVFRTAKQILLMQRQSRHFLPRITASVLQMGTVTVPQSPKPPPVQGCHLAAQGKPQSRPARQAVIVNLTSALCNHVGEFTESACLYQSRELYNFASCVQSPNYRTGHDL